MRREYSIKVVGKEWGPHEDEVGRQEWKKILHTWDFFFLRNSWDLGPYKFEKAERKRRQLILFFKEENR